MTANFAKLFIVLTLIFEVFTITTGSTFYPAFIALSAALFAGLIIKELLSHKGKFNSISAAHVSHDHGTLQSMYNSFRSPV